MIKRLVFYILSLIAGIIICGLLHVMNQDIGNASGSIFISLYFLKAFYDIVNSSLMNIKFPITKKTEHHPTLYAWVEAKNKGYFQLENKILQGEPKQEFLGNLKLIRYQLLKLGKEDAKLLRAYLNVVDKNEYYNQFALTIVSSLLSGLLFWYLKGSYFKEININYLDGAVNVATYLGLIIIAVVALISQNIKHCYKTRILIELLDSIEDDEYL